MWEYQSSEPPLDSPQVGAANAARGAVTTLQAKETHQPNIEMRNWYDEGDPTPESGKPGQIQPKDRIVVGKGQGRSGKVAQRVSGRGKQPNTESHTHQTPEISGKRCWGKQKKESKRRLPQGRKRRW